MQHVARRAGAPHFGNGLSGPDLLTFGDQTFAIVPVGGQKLIVVLDDDQLAVANQSGTGIHHDAAGCGMHDLTCRPGDIDALTRGIARHETADDITRSRPAPDRCTAAHRGGGCSRHRRRGSIDRRSARLWNGRLTRRHRRLASRGSGNALDGA